MTEPSNPLEYRDGKLDLPVRWKWRVQFVVGALTGCAGVILCGVSLTLGNIHYTPSTQPTSWQTNQFEWRRPLEFGSIVLGVVAVIALIAHRMGYRAFAAGAVCGIGTMLLIEGACFLHDWG